MQWYAAECLYYAEVADEQEGDQVCEYRYFLIKASDDQTANDKARQIAKDREHSYLNSSGKRVQWLLDAVVEVKEILDDTLSEGTELYHKYCSGPAPKSTQA